MERFPTRVDDGTLAIETPDGWLTIGDMETIVDIVGGETYTIEYTEKEASVPWLDAGDDGRLTIDVRDTLADYSFDREFVQNVANTPLDETNADDYPKRTALFVDLVTTIWESKGTMNAQSS